MVEISYIAAPISIAADRAGSFLVNIIFLIRLIGRFQNVLRLEGQKDHLASNMPGRGVLRFGRARRVCSGFWSALRNLSTEGLGVPNRGGCVRELVEVFALLSVITYWAQAFGPPSAEAILAKAEFSRSTHAAQSLRHRAVSFPV